MPRRSAVTSTMNTRPSTSRHSAPMPGTSCKMSRSHSQTAAPISGPTSVPTPPIMVCITNCPDWSSANRSGGT